MDAERQAILDQLDAVIADQASRGDRIKALQMKIDLLGLAVGGLGVGAAPGDKKRPAATGPQYAHDPAQEEAMKDFKLRERAQKLDAAIAKKGAGK